MIPSNSQGSFVRTCVDLVPFHQTTSPDFHTKTYEKSSEFRNHVALTYLCMHDHLCVTSLCNLIKKYRLKNENLFALRILQLCDNGRSFNTLSVLCELRIV